MEWKILMGSWSAVILLIVNGCTGSPFEAGLFGGVNKYDSEANHVPRMGRRSPVSFGLGGSGSRSFRFIRNGVEGNTINPKEQGGQVFPNTPLVNKDTGVYNNPFENAGFRFRNSGGMDYLMKRAIDADIAATGSNIAKRIPTLARKYNPSSAVAEVQDYYWTQLLDEVAKNAFNAKLAKLDSVTAEAEAETRSAKGTPVIGPTHSPLPIYLGGKAAAVKLAAAASKAVSKSNLIPVKATKNRPFTYGY